MFGNQSNIDELVNEYKEQRAALKKMISDLEQLKLNVEKLFPEKLDARNIRFLEEKIKATTDLYKALLDIRKELGKNVKDEFDIRKSIKSPKDEDEDDLGNIAELAKQVQSIIKSSNTPTPPPPSDEN